MVSKYSIGSTNGNSWYSYIEHPSFRWTNETNWRAVGYAYATQGGDAWLDQTCLWGHGSYNVNGRYWYDGNYDEPFGIVVFYPSQSQLMPTDTEFWDPTAPPSLGGCPYVSTWNGSSYVLDNNLLAKSESSGWADVTDYYLLQQPLALNRNGTYSLLLSEFEKEHDFFDSIRLLAVDHPSGTHVAVTSEGEILSYTRPHLPVSAVSNTGQNVEGLLSNVSGQYYQGYNGSYITVNFGRLDVSHGAKLVLEADVIKKQSIHVQVQNATKVWRDVAVVEPRVYWATEIVNLSACLPPSVGSLKVRLCFTSNDKLDFVGLDTSPEANTTLQEGKLVSAVHSTDGNATAQLLHNDQTYAELTPGQTIQLYFITKSQTPTGETRNYILITRGHYYTITP